MKTTRQPKVRALESATCDREPLGSLIGSAVSNGAQRTNHEPGIQGKIPNCIAGLAPGPFEDPVSQGIENAPESWSGLSAGSQAGSILKLTENHVRPCVETDRLLWTEITQLQNQRTADTLTRRGRHDHRNGSDHTFSERCDEMAAGVIISIMDGRQCHTGLLPNIRALFRNAITAVRTRQGVVQGEVEPDEAGRSVFVSLE